MARKYIWLVWQIDMCRVETALVQFQELRVIASSEKRANMFKECLKENGKVKKICIL
jgi:hypothetical protein